MKKLVLFSILIINVSIYHSCNNSEKYNCEYNNNKDVKYVSFVLRTIWEGDNYKLIIDDGKFIWESGLYDHDYFTDYKNLNYIVEDYCTLSDSIKLHLFINHTDTLFYIPSKNTGLCYIGTDINRSLIINLYIRDSIYVIGYD